MPTLIFGTAHLFGLVGPTESEQLLDAAYDMGVRRFDTAPSYGHGHSEVRLAEFARRRGDVELISTKAGIAARAGSPRVRALAKRVVSLLPASVNDRLRAASHDAVTGHFSHAEVRESVDRSLQRLGQIDRLLLHEVRPADITPGLIEVLESYRQAGAVTQVGVATRNSLTVACLAQAPQLLTVAHVAIGPLDRSVELPAQVTARVGHGVFGAGGEHLAEMTAALGADAQLQVRWSETTAGTEYAEPHGLSDAMLVLAASGGSDDVIIATSRVDRLRRAQAMIAGDAPLPTNVAAALGEIAQAALARRPVVTVAQAVAATGA